MSAFLVSTECIDNSVMALRSMSEQFRKSDPDLLGMLLIELNRRAVGARYPADGKPQLERPYRYTEPPVGPYGVMQLFKSFSALLYQCSEGDVIYDPTFLAAEAVQEKLAAALGRKPDGTFTTAAHQAAWDRCTWG